MSGNPTMTSDPYFLVIALSPKGSYYNANHFNEISDR